MKKYTSCFVGIPLPEKFQKEFEELLSSIRKITPEFETTYPYTPHITLCYLDEQSQDNLPKIAATVSQSISMLADVQIRVRGIGHFQGDDPKVMFLNVKCPDEVVRFNEKLKVDISIYAATENNLPFQPHMTVAWMDTPSAKQAFWDQKAEISALLNKDWSFKLEEVVLYGVDSTKQPQFQEKLVTLRVHK